jgi:SAM-dependent methyltransferase
MKSLAVSDRWKAHYGPYYAGPSGSRGLAAVDRARNIVALCDGHPHETVLDIGAGEGAVLQRLSALRFGKALYALEISDSAVQAVRQREIAGLVECLLFDGYSLPYADNRFDLAVLSHVVEHLEHPRRLLYEAARVARFVFVEVPLEHTIRMRKDFTFSEVGHINPFTPKTIRRLIQTCELDVLRQAITNSSLPVYRDQSGRRAWPKYLLKELLLRCSPGLATLLLTYQCALLCARRGRSAEAGPERAPGG